MSKIKTWLKPLIISALLIIASAQSAVAGDRLDAGKMSAISNLLEGWVRRADTFSVDRDRILSVLQGLQIENWQPTGSTKYNFLIAVEESLKANLLGSYIERYSKEVTPVIGRELMASELYKDILELSAEDSKLLAAKFHKNEVDSHPEYRPRTGFTLPGHFTADQVTKANRLVDFLLRKFSNFGFLDMELSKVGVVKPMVIDWHQPQRKIAQDIVSYSIDTNRTGQLFKGLKQNMLAGNWNLPAGEIELLDQVIAGQLSKPVHDEEFTRNKNILKDTYFYGAEWVLNEVSKKSQDPEVVEALKLQRAIVPYGRRTSYGQPGDLSERTETQVFRVELNIDRILLFYPSPNGLKLLFGSEASPEVRQAIIDNPFRVLSGPLEGRQKFMAVLALINQADQKVKDKFGKNAVVQGQNPAHFIMQLMGPSSVATELTMSPYITREQLAYFMTSLSEVTCNHLLGSIRH